MVAGVFFNFRCLGSWLQAQLKLGSIFFFQLLQTWLVAASSVEACLLYIFQIFNVWAGGCKLGCSLVSDYFFNFQNPSWWL
jgi:hypothetical protein